MTDEQLRANRSCQYGGGIRECPCKGNCVAETMKRVQQQKNIEAFKRYRFPITIATVTGN